MKEHPLEGMYFELTGPEGASYENFRINLYGKGRKMVRYYGEHDPSKFKPLRVYVKVVGFKDERAPIRNWGRRNFK